MWRSKHRFHHLPTSCLTPHRQDPFQHFVVLQTKSAGKPIFATAKPISGTFLPVTQ